VVSLFCEHKRTECILTSILWTVITLIGKYDMKNLHHQRNRWAACLGIYPIIILEYPIILQRRCIKKQGNYWIPN